MGSAASITANHQELIKIVPPEILDKFIASEKECEDKEYSREQTYRALAKEFKIYVGEHRETFDSKQPDSRKNPFELISWEELRKIIYNAYQQNPNLVDKFPHEKDFLTTARSIKLNHEDDDD